MGTFTRMTRRAALIAGCITGAGTVACVELSDREPCILLPGQDPVPSVGEVEQSHVQQEHRVVTS